VPQAHDGFIVVNLGIGRSPTVLLHITHNSGWPIHDSLTVMSGVAQLPHHHTRSNDSDKLPPMQTLTELNDHYSIPGILTFQQGHGDLLCAQITTAACTATLYLHGAHLTHWQPEGQVPVIFLSAHSNFAADKAIRGGIPIIFPWFGPRADGPGPMHGFARIQVWDVAFAAVSGDNLHITVTLGPTEESRNLGFDNFRIAYEFIFGRELTLRFSVANQSIQPLHFEEGLHTYFHVSDVANVSLLGLANTEFLDKIDNFKRKRQTEELLHITGPTDRPYLNTEATVTLEDPGFSRRIVIAKQGSKTTVVWNPWSTLAANIADLGNDEWPHMLCAETVNAADNALTLQPSEAHTMEAKISIEPITRAIPQ